jgi:hypothetical protein
MSNLQSLGIKHAGKTQEIASSGLRNKKEQVRRISHLQHGQWHCEDMMWNWGLGEATGRRSWSRGDMYGEENKIDPAAWQEKEMKLRLQATDDSKMNQIQPPPSCLTT